MSQRLVAGITLLIVTIFSNVAHSAPAAVDTRHTRPKHLPKNSERAPENSESPLQLWFFRSSLDAAYQSTGGYSVSAEISWNPAYKLNNHLKLVGQLGASEFNTELDTYFTVIDYGGLLAFPIAPDFELELGGGGQYWLGDGGNTNLPAVNFNFAYLRNDEEKPTVKKVFLGYSGVIISNMFTHMLKFGIEI